MKDILIRLFAHEELSHEEACNLMKGITRGDYNEAQIASLLTVFQMRGVKVNELTGFREALLTTRVPVDFSDFQPIDIVGTGGDGKNTFNISTCACFIVAGAGYAVAKHGNYGATSVSGASNVMEQHGVKFTNDESKLRRSVETCGMAYLHAPLFNPVMKTVAPVRKALQVRTLFNLLGPLVNPCLPAFQLLGVADLPQMRLYTNTLQRLNIGFVVVKGRIIRRKNSRRSCQHIRQCPAKPCYKSPDRLCSDKCFVRHTSPRTTKANRRMRINGQRITGKRTGLEHIL